MTGSALSGRIALITGAASGIGLATAEALANVGAQVIAADLHPTAARQDARIRHEQLDVRSGDSVDALWARLNEQDSLPDILISNAGLGVHERLTEGDPQLWANVLETNLLGALRMVRAFVPPMLAADGGDVVFVGSVAADKPHPWGGVYAASKSALKTVAETLRLEAQPQVRVCTIAPGVVDTPFYRHELGAARSVEEIGCGSLTPEQVGRLICYALMQPDDMAIDQLTVRPRAQSF